MKFTYSGHAVSQYAVRTGAHIESSDTRLREAMKGAVQIGKSKALQQFPISHHTAGDTYWVWYEPVIDEYVCAIARKNGAVVTVLTENVYGSTHRGTKCTRDIDVMLAFKRGSING